MKTSALYALAAAQLAAAHTTVFKIWVNDVDQGLGNSADGYIRSPPNNDPVKDVTSSSMTCNVNNAATAKTVEVAGGDKITFEWHHNNADASDDIIADSHKGPVMVYIAPTESNGEGNVWLKLYEDGLSGGKWAVDTLIANKGKHDITLPDLAAGEYLLRPEIIALHEGFNEGGAQFYMECVQIKVTSSGAVSLPEGVAIPGTYSAQDPGILVNIYPTPETYTIPGPALWDGASGSGSGSSPASSAAAPASSAAAATSAAAVSSVLPNVTSAPAASSAPAVSSAPAAQPTTFATSVKPAPTGTSGAVAKYGQCGGKGHTGATTCAENWTCKSYNEYYSQCIDPSWK